MNFLNASMLLDHAARLNPDKTYCIYQNHKQTYKEICADANRFAHVLTKLGVKQNDTVALLLPNSPVFAVCQFGILKRGAIPVPINVTTPAPELSFLLEDTRAVMLIADETFLSSAQDVCGAVKSCHNLLIVRTPGNNNRPLSELQYHVLMADSPALFQSSTTRPDDPAGILYTAGTTGQPKGVVLTHFNY
ncbi:AMP-binding protein, partial [candidate division CSSED10-310 bacterium]